MLERVDLYLGSHDVPFWLSSYPSPGPLPPLGVLTILDEPVMRASTLTSAAFGLSAIVENPHDNFARVEQPRVASLAVGGEPFEATSADEHERKVA